MEKIRHGYLVRCVSLEMGRSSCLTIEWITDEAYDVAFFDEKEQAEAVVAKNKGHYARLEVVKAVMVHDRIYACVSW